MKDIHGIENENEINNSIKLTSVNEKEKFKNRKKLIIFGLSSVISLATIAGCVFALGKKGDSSQIITNSPSYSSSNTPEITPTPFKTTALVTETPIEITNEPVEILPETTEQTTTVPATPSITSAPNKTSNQVTTSSAVSTKAPTKTPTNTTTKKVTPAPTKKQSNTKPDTITKDNINDEDVLMWYSLDIYTGTKKLTYDYEGLTYEFGNGHSCMRVLMTLANINDITGTDFDMYFAYSDIADLRKSCAAITAMATGELGIEFNFNNVSIDKNVNTYLMNNQKLVLSKNVTEFNARVKNFFNKIKVDGISYGDNILVDFMVKEAAKANCTDAEVLAMIAKEDGKIEGRLNQALQQIYDFAHPKTR